MSLKIGIVGLPNVGKSTLFNALTRTRAAVAANYPFCTIDPNVGIVEVPDPRLKKLAELVHPEKIIPAAVEFVDIAGLVKGASEGEGLGNKFLSHIRECPCLAQVVRFFEDPDILHVHGGINPKLDMDVIQLELMLADLETLNRRLADRKIPPSEIALLKRIKEALEEEKLAVTLDFNEEEKKFVKTLNLLTSKPFLIIANVKEDQLKDFREAGVLPISAKLEEDLVDFTPDEAANYLAELGLKESGLNAVIRAAYKLLGLHTYFTAGPKEVRAWTIPIGAKAPEAAGVIHTDFERGFIKADTISYADYIACGGELAAREKGKLRQEGRDYTVADGDVMHFKFNV